MTWGSRWATCCAADSVGVGGSFRVKRWCVCEPGSGTSAEGGERSEGELKSCCGCVAREHWQAVNRVGDGQRKKESPRHALPCRDRGWRPVRV